MNPNLKLRNLTVLLGSTTTVLAATIISPALPGMAAAFADVPNGDFLVRLTLTMPALFIALVAPFAGDLLDRLGRKPVLVVSLILYGFAGTAGYFLESLPAILASRALLGVAVAGTMSGFTTLLLDYFKGSELNRYLGLQAAFMGSAGMIFMLIAGFVAGVGWQYPFLAYLMAFLLLPGVILFVEEPEREKDSTGTGVAGARAKFPWRRLLPVYATAVVGMVIFNVFLVQIPFYLSANGGVSSSLVGLALSMQGLSSVFMALQYGRLKARMSFQAIYGLVFLTFALNHLILVMSTSYVGAFVGLLISGLGIGLFPTTGSGWLASIAPAELRGKAVGGLTSMIFLGQFLSPIVAQPFVSQVGLVGTFALSALAALLVAMVFAFSVIRQRQAPQIPTEV